MPETLEISCAQYNTIVLSCFSTWNMSFQGYDFEASIAFLIEYILVERCVVEESRVKVVFRALPRSKHYPVPSITPFRASRRDKQ
jgi:hypothetical protein